MNVFDLFAKISLDTSEYDEGLDAESKKTSSFASKIGGGLKTAAKIGVGAIAAVGTAATAMTGAMVKGASQVAAYGDNIDKMSQKMGLSASKQGIESFPLRIGNTFSTLIILTIVD